MTTRAEVDEAVARVERILAFHTPAVARIEHADARILLDELIRLRAGAPRDG